MKLKKCLREISVPNKNLRGKTEKTALSISLLVLLFFLGSISLFGLKNPLLLPARGQETPAQKFILTSTSAATLSVCSRCHPNIDDFKNPKLTFKHKNHLARGYKCSLCHTQFPHQNDKIIKPAMEACFRCHGTYHGKQGQISKDCNLCHPQGRRKPQSHTATWSTSHKNVARDELFSCLMCHTQKSCIDCHTRLKVKPITLVIPTAPKKEPKVELEPITYTIPITAASCLPCHLNIDTFSNPKLIFSYGAPKSVHGIHFAKGIYCYACHKNFPHSQGKTETPSMYTCADCHAVYHGEGKLIAIRDCFSCHPKNFNLKAKPADHLTPQWDTNHGKQPRDVLAKCYSCHQEADCIRCHKTPTPHPVLWYTQHRKFVKKSAANRADCAICHKEKSFCESCHHFDKNILITKECISCHKVFKRSWKIIAQDGEQAKVKGNRVAALEALNWSIHKAHVAKKYRCTACHQKNLEGLLASSTFLICGKEDCHSTKKPGKEGLITGDELCRLCHPQK